MSSTTTGVSVRNADAADADRLAATFSAAFFDDPVMSWCYPDPDRRQALLTAFFRTIIDATLAGGGIYTTTDLAAGAIWVPPDPTADGHSEDELMAALAAVSGQYAGRVQALSEALAGSTPAQPYQYLLVVGTRPEWQSRGRGSALLRPVLDRCDRDGTPAYLEATSERNARLYQRNGFAVTEEVTVPDGPVVRCMWRTPR